MNRYIILVGIGGLLGSITRYLIASFTTQIIPSTFPYGTFAVNITGCLIVGMVFRLSERFDWIPEWRLFLATGFCGGFTTFSSFAHENILLLHQLLKYISAVPAEREQFIKNRDLFIHVCSALGRLRFEESLF